MLGGFDDLDRTLAVMDELRRRMGVMLDEYDDGPVRGDGSLYGESASWPRVNVLDTGNALVFKADVPGMTEKDVEVSIQNDTLTLRGERRSGNYPDHTLHRQERRAIRFSRSFAIPCPADIDKAQATVRDGVLTITLPKAPEAQPKKIAVLAQ